MNTEISLLTDNEAQVPTRLSAFGFSANPGTLDEYLSLVAHHVGCRAPISIFYHNQHTLYGYFTNERLKQCYKRATVIADGMCVVWLCKIAGFKLTREHRLTYVDFIIPLMEMAQSQGWRVYHIGQETNVLNKALQTIRTDVPGIAIDGHHGYFDQTAHSTESIDVIDKINAHVTDILLVGFGTPSQEYWVDAHRNSINAPVILTCGACMEYVAGAVRTPPRWMGRIGMEWSFRLMENPRRFAHRYTVQTIKLSLILCRNWFRNRFAESGKA